MIQIEILNSPDKSAVGCYRFFKNQIYIGFSSGNLHIRDNQLLESHLLIEVIESELIVHPQKNVNHYHLDGKRASTIRKIKADQILTIGQTSIKILNFNQTDTPSKKSLLDAKLASYSESNSPMLSVIEKLAKMMS